MTAPRRRRAGARGQAALEVVAAVPVVLAAGLVAWQIVAVMWAAVRAEEAARRAALTAPGAPAGLVSVVRTVPVPGPLAGDLAVTVRARVLAP